jgi:hypothetical protein
MPQFGFSFVRLFGSLAVVAAAGLAARGAALAYWRSLAPGAVPQLAADDPRIVLSRVNLAIAEGTATQADRAALRPAVEAVLRHDPLDPTALSTRGRIEQQAPRGLALVKLAERLTRRDGPTELMLIEASSQADDLPGVLVHYDRLLMVDPGATPLLQPVLARGLSDAAIRDGLLRYARRPWFRPFVLSALTNQAAPDGILALIDAAKGQMERADLLDVVRNLAGQFVNTGRLAELRGLQRILPPDLRGETERFGFAAGMRPLDGSALGWTMENTTDGEATVSAQGGLGVRVAPELRLVVARRYTFLAPGRFVLRQQVSNDTGAAPARLEWQVTCPDAAAPAQPSLVPLDGAGQSAGAQRFLVTIPADCLVQNWALFASGSVSQEPARASLAALSLSPA